MLFIGCGLRCDVSFGLCLLLFNVYCCCLQCGVVCCLMVGVDCVRMCAACYLVFAVHWCLLRGCRWLLGACCLPVVAVLEFVV